MRKVDLLRAKIDRLIPMLTEKQVTVTQRGAVPYTVFDPETNRPTSINIPKVPDEAGDMLLGAVEGYIDHEVGHVLFSDGVVLNGIDDNASLKVMHNIVEDTYIERKMAEKFTGSASNLSRLADLYGQSAIQPLLRSRKRDREAIDRAFLIPAIMAWSGCPWSVDFMKDKWEYIPEMVATVAEYAKRELPKVASTKDSLRVARKIVEMLDFEASEGDRKSLLKISAEGSRLDDAKDKKPAEESTDLYADLIRKEIEKQINKTEKKDGYRVYTTEFDVIRPVEVSQRVTSEVVTRLEQSVAGILGVIQKKLERAVNARSLGYWVGGHRSGKMKASSLTRFIVRDDNRIFKRKHISNVKDTAVTLLIDCSGSMKWDDRIKIASKTAYALSCVLERMNIRNEVLGFTTGENIQTHVPDSKYRWNHSRKETLLTYIFKGFNEKLVYEQKARFASVMLPKFPMNNNVDGESVMIAANRLLARGEKRKILIVLSDGVPAASGGVAFHAHLKRTTEYIENNTDIELIGIGINTDSVKNFYRRNVVLKKVSDLPTICLDELQKLLLKPQ